jgi:membrane fusion protein, multidrug efflux system
MLKRIYGVFIATGLAALLGGCGHSSPPEHAQASAGEVAAKVETVRQQALPVYATFPGSVVSADQVQVASRLTGYVRKLYVHEGQTVKKGQLLLSVDPTDVKGGIEQARAAVSKAEAALADAKANYERYQALYEQHAVPQQRFQQIEMAYKVAQGNYVAAQSVLRTARSQLSYSDVRAPFAGTVVGKFIDTGQLATPGQPLLTLQSSGHLQVQVQIDSRAFDHLRFGQKVGVTFDGSDFKRHTVQGVVERLVNAADPMTHSHTVKIGLADNSGAASGDYARVQVPLGDQPGIVVPASAMQRRAGIQGVFVVDKDGSAEFRMVQAGESMDGGVVVLAGLVPGDRVVVSTQGELYNGVKIKGDGA